VNLSSDQNWPLRGDDIIQGENPSVGDPGYYLEATEEFDPRSWPPDGQKVADALFACHQAYRCALKTFWAVSHEDREHFGLTAAPEP
jgi:hypothetical protein